MNIQPSKKNPLSLPDLLLYFLTLGTTGFGGPIALVGYMHRDLVLKKKWITQEEYGRGLTLSQIAPGPFSTQLAIYIGFIRYGVIGATLVAITYVLPSFLMVLGISIFYIKFGELPQMQAVLYGMNGAIIGVVASSAYKLATSTIRDKKALWIVFFVAFAFTVYTKQGNVLLILVSGFIAMYLFSPSSVFSIFLTPPLASFLHILNSQPFIKLFLFFAQASIVVYGSGLAIVPFLYGGVVEQNHWLTEKQFLDAVTVAMITPGPVVITAGFIGYIISGFWGALIASLGIFLPVYFFVIIPAPFFERYAKHPQLLAFVEGATTAATGTIAASVIILGQQSIKDGITFLVFCGALFLSRRFKVSEPLIIVAAGVLGLIFLRTG